MIKLTGSSRIASAWALLLLPLAAPISGMIPTMRFPPGPAASSPSQLVDRP